jgi:hypothetical protein
MLKRQAAARAHSPTISLEDAYLRVRTMRRTFSHPAATFCSGSQTFHTCGKNWTFAAYLHLSAPTFLSLPVAYRPVDEPAEVSDSEFPGWASLPGLGRAATNFPAGTGLLPGPLLQGLQKEQLPLDVPRHLPPTLLKALHGLKRGSQNLGHLLLGLLQFPPESLKLFAVHIYPSFGEKVKKFARREKFYLTDYTTL